MLVVRSVRDTDLDALVALAQDATCGLTTLPRDRTVLGRRIVRARRSFEDLPERPQGELYLFVAEETETGRVVGTCGIESKVGGFEPFYAYRVVTKVHESLMLSVRKEIQELQLVREHDGPSEIGTLFLSGPYRGGGNGRLLSLSRFLFMAEHPQSFEPMVIAEMRGKIDANGRSPFWEALGRHFFDVDLPRADYLSIVNKRFIADLMPKHPIYIPLLPAEAQAVIGAVHDETWPALRLLEEEGFGPTRMVDIFEAGPILSCQLPEIRAVRESCGATVGEVTSEAFGSEDYLIANTRADYRVCRGAVQAVGGEAVRLSHEVAHTLDVKPGDTVRYATLRPSRARGG